MDGFGDRLIVDLGAGTVERVPITPAEAARTLLGRGLNSLTLLDRLQPDVDPLGPENDLMLSAGLLTGSGTPTAARLHASARSPLTGVLGSSSVGGTPGPAVRRHGIASIVLRGRAPGPVLLHIDTKGRARLRDAAAFWGLETTEQARDGIAAHLAAERFVMLLIGPAGEHQLPIACIVTHRGHAAGRTGMGAVMGSKLLKAIVIEPAKGATQKSILSREARAAFRDYVAAIKAAPRYEERVHHGTTTAVGWTQKRGILSTRNYTQSEFEGASRIDGPRLEPLIERRRSCQGCPVGCKAELRLEKGRHAGVAAERPDFEPLVSWGAKSGLDDPEEIVFLHHLCDLYGIDSISAGNAVAFALDLFERGILSPEDTGGLELTWGNAEAMEALVRQMGTGEGFGAVLGQGVRNAAAAIGDEADGLAYHVKGLELTAFDPRGAFATALGYAVGSRGGDFTSIYARHELTQTREEALERYGDERAADSTSPVGKAAMVRRGMIVCAVLDSIGICKIPILSIVSDYSLEREAELVTQVTGVRTSADDLFTTGERIVTAERLLNLRFGATAADDALPERFLEEALPDGPRAGSRLDLQSMLAEFYQLMGWSSSGVPTLGLLRRLGLLEHAPDAAGD